MKCKKWDYVYRLNSASSSLSILPCCQSTLSHSPCPSDVDSLKDEPRWNGLGCFKEAEDEPCSLLTIALPLTSICSVVCFLPAQVRAAGLFAVPCSNLGMEMEICISVWAVHHYTTQWLKHIKWYLLMEKQQRLRILLQPELCRGAAPSEYRLFCLFFQPHQNNNFPDLSQPWARPPFPSFNFSATIMSLSIFLLCAQPLWNSLLKCPSLAFLTIFPTSSCSQSQLVISGAAGPA